ncbi:MAG TPA: hypothetical protein VKT28_02715 [Puia sp.]|nr:hypothetical protein [Puia sp.]
MKSKLPAIICLAAGVLLLAFHFLPFGKGSLNVTIKQASYIMPAAYKVYANSDALNGEYYLFKMLMNNDGKTTLSDVKVSYRIPNYVDWTDLETIPKIYPGQNAVVRCYPQFKDDIVNKMTQSQEKVEIKITYNGSQTLNEDFKFNMMGRNQFVYTDLPPEEIASYPDMFRNDQLVGCFVTPQDPIIKYYTQQIQEKVMKGEEASVSNKSDDAVKFLMGLYAATYVSHMVYSGTEGIPQKLGDVNSLVQSTRLPREVVTGNTGLCIELSILYASVLKAAGLHPIIFMIPGHAYPGILVNGQYYAIEATGIGGEGLGSRASPADALKAGMKELNEFIQAAQSGDNRYSFIDIDAMESKGVIPMELRDDEFLRKKIDDIAASFSGGARTVPRQPESTLENNNVASSGGGGGSSMSGYSGVVSFNYPSSWKRYDYPVAQWPFLVAEIGSRDGSSAIDVIDLSGANSSSQAIEYIRQTIAKAGRYMRYQYVNSNNGYDIYRGTTSSNNGTREWEAVFRRSQNGIVGVTIGGSGFSQKQNMFNSILSTVR